MLRRHCRVPVVGPFRTPQPSAPLMSCTQRSFVGGGTNIIFPSYSTSSSCIRRPRVHQSPMITTTPYSSHHRHYGFSRPLEDADRSTNIKVTNKESLALALRFAWPHDNPGVRMNVMLALLCVGASKILAVSVPFAFKHIIDFLTAQTTLVMPAAAGTATTTSAAAGGAGGGASAMTVLKAGAAVEPVLFGTAVTIGMGSLIAAYVIVKVTAAATNEARSAIFAHVSAHIHLAVTDAAIKHLQQLDLSFHVKKQSGAVLRVVERGVSAVTSLALYSLLILLPTGIEFALVIGLLSFQVGWEVSAMSVTAVALYVFWTARITKWRMKFRDDAIHLETKRSTLVSDSLTNYETVAYFNAVESEGKRVFAVNDELNKTSVKLDQSMALLNVGQQLVFCLAGAASIGLAANGVLMGTMSVGDLVLIDSLLLQLYVPLSWLGIVLREVVTNAQNFRELAMLFKEKSALATTRADGSTQVPMTPGSGSIELKNVTYTFADDPKPLLNDVSLKIPGGAFVGFVGPSGSGKSTILRLIFRFFDVDKGQVLVDGQDVKDITLDSLRKRFAVVPQDVVLFNDTARYNIGYGRAGTSTPATEEEIVEVAKQAHIHDAIVKMSKGYDTVVGERGLRMSGGERQRLSLARALLKDADIVLADEATSALDSVTEAEVVKKLRESSAASSSSNKKQRTVVCVAHRLSTIKDCDIIFVLNNEGALAEQGTHAELLANKGLYHKLWCKQQKKQHHQHQKKEHEAAVDECSSDDAEPKPAATA